LEKFEYKIIQVTAFDAVEILWYSSKHPGPRTPIRGKANFYSRFQENIMAHDSVCNIILLLFLPPMGVRGP